jgi:hypothetical protein
MSAMIIRIEETHVENDGERGMTGMSVIFTFDELEIGAVLPGLAPSIMRAVNRVINESLSDPYKGMDGIELPTQIMIH